VGTSHGLLNDWLGHLHYIPAFALGYLLASQPEIWGALRRAAPWAAAVAAAGFLMAVVVQALWPDHGTWTHAQLIVFDCADSGFAWSMMLLLPVIANRWFNHDHRWRLPLSRAVFPAYIVHQTAIVMILFWLRDAGLPTLVEATIVLSGTLLACIAAWAVARRGGVAGVLLGYSDTISAPAPASVARA